MIHHYFFSFRSDHVRDSLFEMHVFFAEASTRRAYFTRAPTFEACNTRRWFLCVVQVLFERFNDCVIHEYTSI